MGGSCEKGSLRKFRHFPYSTEKLINMLSMDLFLNSNSFPCLNYQVQFISVDSRLHLNKKWSFFFLLFNASFLLTSYPISKCCSCTFKLSVVVDLLNVITACRHVTLTICSIRISTKIIISPELSCYRILYFFFFMFIE